jgi:Holliday junction resolvase-like predicted endonuclease
VAAAFLESRGASVLSRNVRIDRGEIDLVVALDGERVAVEVKAGLANQSRDPIYHFDDAKQRQVRMLANRYGISRVDYVGVELSEDGATVRWLPRIC